MEDLYTILCCNETASFQELKKSYQTLALQYHPDKSESTQNGSEKFVKIHRAWTILSDMRLRQQYDARWKERCLAQAYPVQDTVYFDEFEKLETCKVNSTDVLQKCKELCQCGLTKTAIGCNQQQDTNENITDRTEAINGKLQSLKNKVEVAEIDTPCANDSDSSRNKNLLYKQMEGTGDTPELSPLSDDDTIYMYECRCGGNYVLTGLDVQLQFDLVCCDTCSLSVQVIYVDKEEGETS